MTAVTILPPRRQLRLALPTAVLAALALPFMPFVALGLFAVTDRPFLAAWSLWRVLGALSGTVVEVDTPHALVFIRLF
jgi:hypothetical protein